MSGEFRVGPSLVQPSLNSIIHKGKTARLEPKMMEVLVYLAEHQGQVVPKERLMRAVWAVRPASPRAATLGANYAHGPGLYLRAI